MVSAHSYRRISAVEQYKPFRSSQSKNLIFSISSESLLATNRWPKSESTRLVWGQFHVFASSSDWFMTIVASFVIGSKLLFRVGFSTVIRKAVKRKGVLISLQDLTCIVWDLSKLTYVRQLSQHMAPITAIAINDLTVSRASFFHE